jgi:hypothetical protein
MASNSIEIFSEKKKKKTTHAHTQKNTPIMMKLDGHNMAI